MSAESSPASRAVFLSYASQDAEAARRICEALRAAGVEVWFDQSELRSGEQWDREIKRRIRECALFLPVISANTNARLEGYFRREWKLAVERTHDMADEKAFLVPVVIDATADAAASVPEKFRDVQWTRLRDGETSAAFCDRVKELLGGHALETQRPRPVERGATPTADSSAEPKRRGVRLWLLVAALVVITLSRIGSWFPRPPAPAEASGRGPGPVAVADPVVNDRTIAVLPFTNMSDDKENAFFADGVHEDVLTTLANLHALKVISRTSMLQYRDTKKLTGQIGRELGATYLLEGSVRRAGATVRVTAQLIKAATDEHVWAKAYDRDVKDIFAVQTELAREIATSLHAALSPAEVASLAAQPTKSIEAYECFQKAQVLGRSNANERDVREKIVPLLERAVALDPDYAAAWAYLSRQHAVLYYSLVDHTEARFAQLKDALARAERLAPDSYPVLLAGKDFAGASGNRAVADDRRRRIIELFSDRAESRLMMAREAEKQARWTEAQASYRAALRLDPRNPEVLGSYLYMLDAMRHWDEAEAVAATLTEVQPDNLEMRLQAASMVFRRTGSPAQLTRLLAELPRTAEAQTGNIAVRSRIAFLTGDWTGIIELWREAGPRFRTGGFSDRVARSMVAEAFLKLVDPGSARPLLEQNREELRKLLQPDPENISKQIELGVILGMLDDRAGARAALDVAGRLIAARDLKPPMDFSMRWDYAIARSWVDEKSAVVEEIGRLLREPSPRPGLANVHWLRVTWNSLPLHGDPDFEAMLNDPKNNAPLF